MGQEEESGQDRNSLHPAPGQPLLTMRPAMFTMNSLDREDDSLEIRGGSSVWESGTFAMYRSGVRSSSAPHKARLTTGFFHAPE